MVVKLFKCERCKGEGNVRKYIINDCLDCIFEIINAFISSLLYFPLYCIFYGIIGLLLGPIYFILLKKALPFYFFGIIFYSFGGLCISYIIYQIIYKEKKGNIIIYLIFGIISIINLIIGIFLYNKKGGIFILINLLFNSIQGGSIGVVCSYLFYKKEMLEENDGKLKCPLCQGNKYLSKYQFEKLERCKKCIKNCGYENPKINDFIFSRRYFCKNCNGKGYFLKDN